MFFTDLYALFIYLICAVVISYVAFGFSFFFGVRNVDSNKVPIISGLPIEYLAQGMRIPAKYRPLIDQITKISELPQSYFAGISEICVQPKEFGNYELALIPSQSHIKVLTDRSLNEEALKYMMVVLDVVKQLGSDVSEIDLRYGSVSYRTKNQVKNDEIILKN